MAEGVKNVHSLRDSKALGAKKWNGVYAGIEGGWYSRRLEIRN
jgi:hypothetical protein